MKPPSALGASIAALVSSDRSLSPERPPTQYLCAYRTERGLRFAFERVTRSAIRFWVEADDRLARRLDAAGLPRHASRAGLGGLYGRNSNLKPIFGDVDLFWISATSLDDAQRILDALRGSAPLSEGERTAAVPQASIATAEPIPSTASREEKLESADPETGRALERAMTGGSEVSLSALKSRIEAAVGDLDALAQIDDLLSARPEPEARSLRLKIGMLKRRARNPEGRSATVRSAPTSRPALVDTHRPREAVRVPSGPWQAILSANGLERPDGRPLHRYRLDEERFAQLFEGVRERGARGLDHPSPDLPALFVLWAANWFQRGYRGGPRRWEDVAAAIRLPLNGNQGRTLTREGLAAWSRPPVRGEVVTRWLATLAVEGGFPAGVLEDPQGWAARYLEHLVATLLARGTLDEDTALATAFDQEALVPGAYRQEIFHTVAADLALAVVRLRREVEGQDRARDIPASAWLDATRPGWREHLPVPAGSKAAARLVDGLLAVEARVLRGTVGCDRVLRRDRGSSGATPAWSVGIRLHLDGLIAGDALRALAGRRDRLRAVPTGRFARHVAGELALLEPPGEDAEEGWRARRLRPDPVVLDVPPTVGAEVELLAEGRVVHRLCWPNGEPMHGDMLVFAPDDATDEEISTLVGTGPGGYAAERVIVAMPRDWRVDRYGEAAKVELLPGTFDERLQLWSVQGGAVAISPENDRFCLRTGQSGARRDRLVLGGARPSGFVVDEDDVEDFCGLPTWRVFEGGVGREAKSGEVRWRPSGERPWRGFETPPTMGRVDFGWRDVETGFLRDRRRLFLLPADAGLSRRATAQGAVYTPENLPPDAFSSADPAMTLTCDTAGLHVRFAARPARVARLRLAFGEGRPLAVAAPYPAGSGIATWSGACIEGSGSGATAPSLVLAQLRGLVAYSNGPDILFARILDRDRRPLPGGGTRWTFRDELPLRGVAEDFEALLSQHADIDAFVELFLQGAGRYWRVRQFEGAPVVRSGVLEAIQGIAGDDDIPAFGRSVASPESEVPLGISAGADRREGKAPALETRAGAHIVYLRRGEEIVTRPGIVVLGPDAADESDAGFGLAAAVRLRDPHDRELAILARLAEIAAGAPDTREDVARLTRLCGSLGSLPPSCLDPLRLLPHVPAAAARVALSAGQDAAAVVGLAERLPFLWCMVSAPSWRAAGEIERAHIAAMLADLGASAADLARSAIVTAAGRLADLEPTLVLPLFAAGLVGSERVGTDRRDLVRAAQDHIRRHGEACDEVGGDPNRFRSVPGLALPDAFAAFSPVHLEILDAPCAAAAVAFGSVVLDADAVRHVKSARRTDPTYFLEAFEARFIELLHGTSS